MGTERLFIRSRDVKHETISDADMACDTTRTPPSVPKRSRKTQIVVVGGGAGGLELVRRLGAKYGRKKHDIILVDQNLSHIRKPLLHEVAAGSLDANLDEVGYRGHCARWGYRFFQGSLQSIDREAKTISLAPVMDDHGEELIGGHTIRYDITVFST